MELVMRRHRASSLAVYLGLVTASLVVILPFVWLLISSLETNAEFISSDKLLPTTWTLANYMTVFTQIPMPQLIYNGLFIAVLATAGGLLASAMAAFTFAKLKFRGKGVLFTLTLMTMMIPWAVTLIPLYIIIRSAGLVNTLWALILPNWTGSAFAVFFLRQHMLSIPHDLYEAAKVDGCSPLRALVWIYLPLTKAPLATLATLNFLTFWNDLLGPLIYLNSPDKMTLTVGLTYFQGQYVTNYPVLLAGVIICLIPTSLVFLFFGRYIRQGMLITGLK